MDHQQENQTVWSDGDEYQGESLQSREGRCTGSWYFESFRVTGKASERSLLWPVSARAAEDSMVTKTGKLSVLNKIDGPSDGGYKNYEDKERKREGSFQF